MVVGPSVDRDALTAYVNMALDRCRALGATVVVWGSAGSRNVPEGFPRERAWEQIVSFLRMAGPPLAPARARQIGEMIARLEEVEDIGEFTRLLAL